MTDRLPRFVEVRPHWCTFEVNTGIATQLVSAKSPERAKHNAEAMADRLNWWTTYGDPRLWPLFGCIDIEADND